MPLEITESRRKQRRITQISFALSGVFFAILFLVFRYTPVGDIVKDRVVDMIDAIAPPPPPPPPPPDIQKVTKAPPKIDMDFSVKNLATNPDINADFSANLLPDMAADVEGFNLAPQAMTLSETDLSNVVSNMQLATISLGLSIGFNINEATLETKKGAASGFGRRTTGKVALAVLDLPGDEDEYPWNDGELEDIVDFISKNSNLKAELGARAISFIGTWDSFNSWFEDARGRALSEPEELTRQEPEIQGLDLLANAVPYVAEGAHEQFRSRVKKIVTDYLRIRFDARIRPEDGDWVDAIEEVNPLPDWQKAYIRDAEASFLAMYNRREPTGREIRGIYMLLRLFELMQLPILFCEPRGVLGDVLPENVRLLRTYINHGGFIYFINTGKLNRAYAIRGFITKLTGETLADPVGEKTLAELSANDQSVSGYVFRDPEPIIFHPWTFFPMILPRYTDVYLSIYNKIGNMVFTDTLADMLPGAYLQKYRHYRWHAVDNQGNPVESGYYIYQIESDLLRKTGPMRVSILRKLPNGKHGIFSAFYPISEVPTTQTVKSEELPYGEKGVFGVSLRGRLAICYTEGYKEKGALTSDDVAAEENALKWMTNVVIHALAEGSLAR